MTVLGVAEHANGCGDIVYSMELWEMRVEILGGALKGFKVEVSMLKEHKNFKC